MKKTTKLYILSIIMLLGTFSAAAQCEIMNNAFKSGENITYDLYFNYGLIKSKAGAGSMTTQMVNYKDNSAYNIRMLLNTSGLVGSFYSVNDTLVSYIDMNLRPLIFTKNAHEGKDYSKEVQTFNYSADGVKIRTSRIFNNEKKFDDTLSTQSCTYDYLSVLPLIRNLDYSDMKPGDYKHIQFVSGKQIVNMTVNYGGKSKVKANDGKTYNTIDISMAIHDDAFKNKKEAISASITDDANRVPIVINTHIKLGVIRAVMKDMTGLRN